MKFEPMRLSEPSAEFYGQRGMSCHRNVVFLKEAKQEQVQCSKLRRKKKRKIVELMAEQSWVEVKDGCNFEYSDAHKPLLKLCF